MLYVSVEIDIVCAKRFNTPEAFIADSPKISGFVLFHPPNELEELVETLPSLSLLELEESRLLELSEELLLVELLDKDELLEPLELELLNEELELLLMLLVELLLLELEELELVELEELELENSQSSIDVDG